MDMRANRESPVVKELIEVTQALTEGNFERKLGNEFEGELGQLAAYIETLRQNLKSLSPRVTSSIHLIPKAGQGIAEISQQAEMGVNSILGLVDEMCADQEAVVEMFERVEQGDISALNVQTLREIADKTKTSLMSLMSFLSFQDVVRQHAEKVQAMIDAVEEKIRELLAKFKLKAHEPDEGDDSMNAQSEEVPVSQDVVDQSLIDDLFK
jgi:methyl-accepting chemotaxis protein